MKQSTQSKILHNAEKLLWLKGYEGTSLNEVVAGAGVSKGAFFHYYPTKQAISRDVIDKYAQAQLLGLLGKHLDSTPSVKAALLGWIEENFETFKTYGFRGGCLLGNLALELSDQNDAAREAIKQHFLDLENMLVSALKPLAAEQKLSMEPRQLARLLVASVQGVTMTGKVHKDHNRASREFQAIGQLIEHMIKD